MLSLVDVCYWAVKLASILFRLEDMPILEVVGGGIIDPQYPSILPFRQEISPPTEKSFPPERHPSDPSVIVSVERPSIIARRQFLNAVSISHKTSACALGIKHLTLFLHSLEFHTFHLQSRFRQSLQRRELPQEMRRALISHRIDIQISLMVVLSVPPLASWHDVGDDFVLPPLLVGLLGDLLGDGFLLRVVVEDAGAVLRAGVGTLLVEGCWVVHLVEVLEELAVGDLLWVVEDLDGLGVCRTLVAIFN